MGDRASMYDAIANMEFAALLRQHPELIVRLHGQRPEMHLTIVTPHARLRISRRCEGLAGGRRPRRIGIRCTRRIGRSSRIASKPGNLDQVAQERWNDLVSHRQNRVDQRPVTLNIPAPTIMRAVTTWRALGGPLSATRTKSSRPAFSTRT